MPRLPRVKKSDAIYHIMIRSISEVPLFRENKDKEHYLSLMKGYKEAFGFKVYAYCLMDNHAHFIIDANGADISRIMHGLNFKYAHDFNKKYKRNGHLFQDRFKSKMVTSERYIISLSAYIHNNPLDIKKYKNCPEKYKFSSLGVYLGMRKDPFEILDEDFIMQLFGENVGVARKNYLKFVYMCSGMKEYKEVEFTNEKTHYKSERKVIARDYRPSDIMEFVSEETGISKIKLYLKNSRNTIEGRALAVLLMRSLCNFRCSDICRVLNNITQSRVSKLCSIGLKLIETEEKYRNIFEKFIEKYAA
jgi:putative transposase